MRSHRLIPITVIFGLITGLALCSPANSQEQKPGRHRISAKGKVSDVNGSKAKYHEYSDDGSGGVFGDLERQL